MYSACKHTLNAQDIINGKASTKHLSNNHGYLCALTSPVQELPLTSELEVHMHAQ